MLLKDIIEFAYNNTFFYKKSFDENLINPNEILSEEDLSLLPFLTKDQIRNNTTQLLVSGKSNLIKERTSGTSGEALEIYKSHSDIVRSNFSMIKFRKQAFGLLPNVKSCHFYMFSRNDLGKLTIDPVRKTQNTLSLNIFSYSDKQFYEYLEAINDFHPEYVLSIPSSLCLFANFIEKNNLKVTKSIKWIELKGEYVFKNQIELIKRVFDCFVINHYGTTETYGIAMSCKEGKLHILEDNCIVELIDENGMTNKTGQICVTTLNNSSMPLIRYLLDDKGEISNIPCKCGLQSKTLLIFSGRTTDYIELSKENRINSGILYFAIEQINYEYENIVQQFQVIQQRLGELIIYIVTTNGLTDVNRLEERFVEVLSEYGMEDFNFIFHYKSSLKPSAKTGKLKYFINEIENQGVKNEKIK